MRLQLTIDVPATADQDEVLTKLMVAQARSQGITVIPIPGYAFDADLVVIERVGLRSTEASL